MRKIIFSIFLFLVLVVSPVWAFEIPNYQNYVTDLANIYSTEFENKLNEKIKVFEGETEIELAVLTISKLPEASIEEYAVEVFEKWGVGKRGEDNGVLLLISKEDREMRIEVGYGLEGKITDGMAGRIIRDEITPQFRLENYEEGTEAGVEAIMRAAKGEVEENNSVSEEKLYGIDDFVGNFKVVVLGGLFLIYMASFLGRSKEIITGGIVGFILGIMFANLGVALVLAVFGFILDMILSRSYKKSVRLGRPTGFWQTRGGFKSGGGGSSFGGFGGGSSGGGGASGKW